VSLVPIGDGNKEKRRGNDLQRREFILSPTLLYYTLPYKLLYTPCSVSEGRGGRGGREREKERGGEGEREKERGGGEARGATAVDVVITMSCVYVVK